MERHAVGDDAAFELLRGGTLEANRKLIDVAGAVVKNGHALLPKQAD